MVTRLVLVLAAILGIALGAAVPARAEIITGTFTYDDTDPARPMAPPVERAIAGARVDVFSCFPNASGGCNGWGFETTRTTSPTGSIAVFLSNPPGTRYGLRVYASNAAAVVVPSVPASGALLTPFFEKPGLPAGPEITRTVTAPTDVLDFTFRFTDAYSTAHFNVADTLSLGLAYAMANRDPAETDPIPPVRVTPDPSWAGLPFYNPVHKTLVLTPGFMFEDHTLLHEYAHFLEDAISNFLVLPSLHDGCTARSIVDPFGILPPINSPEHAWMEGFADYFASVVDTSLPSGRVVGTLGADAAIESPRAIPESTLPCAAARAAFNGESIELDVAATLFDAFDPLNLLVLGESTDTLEGFDQQVFQIFDRELDGPVAPEIQAFRAAWLARGLPASAFGRLFVLNGIRFRSNFPPLAKAGPDAVVSEGSTVTLDGRSSEDPETSVLGFGWSQTGGPPVALSNTNLSRTTFTAPAVGPAGTVLTFRLAVSDVTGSGAIDTVTVTVRDLGAAPTLSPATLDFGLAGAKKVLTATLTNGGPGPLGVGSKAVTGSSSFGYESSTCGSQLAAGASCTVSVGFTPPPSGAVTGALTVYTSNAPAASVSIDLRGRGGIPTAELDTAALNFGPVNVGATWSQTARLTNTGTVPVAVSGVTISAPGFSNTACPSTLQPGAVCVVTVTFAPTAAGPYGAVLRFQDDGGGPHDVALNGTGSPVGVAVAYPSPSSFGAIGLGAATGLQTFHLVNTGGASFAVSQVAVLGHFAEFPIKGDGCTGTVLPPGGHCVVLAFFAPQATGARAGALTFATTSGPATVLLEGTGIGKPTPGAWPQLAAGAARAGFAPDETTLDAASAATLHVAWDLALKAEAHSSPAVVDGVAYLGVEDGSVYAVDLVKQSVLWSFATGGAVRSSPAVDGGVVYVGSRDGSVYALDAASGAPLWTFGTKGPVDASPAVSGGVVVVGSDDGTLYALDAAGGSLLWSDVGGAPVRSAPAIDGSVAYAAADNGRVRAYELAKGTVLWTAFAGGAPSGVAVSGGAVLVGSSGGRLAALDSRSGAQRWAFAAGAAISSAPAVAYGLVYVGADDGTFYALEEQTGQGVWALPLGAAASVPAIADGVVHVVTTDGVVHAVDAWAQRELGAVEAKALSSAAVVDGAVYVGTADGLAAIGP